MKDTKKNTDIITLKNEINATIENQGDMGQYWIDAHDALAKGYTLPVPMQNLLDDINASLSDKFKYNKTDMYALDMGSFNELVKGIELSHLGLFLTRNGVSHHYHCTAGTDKPWRIEIDLKVLPTVYNKLGEPKAGICFISTMLVTGDLYGTPVGQIPAQGKVLQASKVSYVGLESVRINHNPILTLANANKPLSNHDLGVWLYHQRNVTLEDQLDLIALDVAMR